MTAITTGSFTAAPYWYRAFENEEERARGLGFVEGLASTGTLRFALNGSEAVLALCSDTEGINAIATDDLLELWRDVAHRERERRAAFRTPLHRTADAFMVQRGRGRSILAGYPWFADWGRDTFIGLRGLRLATDRHADAHAILHEWARHVSDGMLPNRFVDFGAEAEYNFVDAALWHVVAVELLRRAAEADGSISNDDVMILGGAVGAIVEGYRRGTRYGIHVGDDGLLAAGVPGVQLTWMAAKLGDWVVTPRIGKPVEIQALWINALRVASRWDATAAAAADQANAAFEARFWNESAGCLFDIADVAGMPGDMDASVRPNPLLADVDAPHLARGCPFQAWSVGEVPRASSSPDTRGTRWR